MTPTLRPLALALLISAGVIFFWPLVWLAVVGVGLVLVGIVFLTKK